MPSWRCEADGDRDATHVRGGGLGEDRGVPDDPLRVHEPAPTDAAFRDRTGLQHRGHPLRQRFAREHDHLRTVAGVNGIGVRRIGKRRVENPPHC